MTLEKNVYKYFVQVTTDVLMGNIFTLSTHNDTLDVITDCNLKLSESWTTGDAGEDIKKALKGVTSGTAIDDFISKYLTTGNANLSQFSEAVGSQIMQLLAKYYKDLPKDKGPMDMNVVNSFNSIIQSTANNEEQLMQNEGKTEGSVVQQDASAQQPIADIGSSVEQILGNLASLVQQIYS